MLALARKEGQTIAIGDNITVTVVSINGTQVKLAIDAPREVRVMRTELVAPLPHRSAQNA